ncbi:hypothetical protein [Paenibacillus sp. yr247]|nr:hypothetical protein [Paenibacillus sp. yr247]
MLQAFGVVHMLPAALMSGTLGYHLLSNAQIWVSPDESSQDDVRIVH